MELLNHDVPPLGQWLGLVGTFAGTAFALWAALSDKSAKKQAEEAKQAAIRLGRVLQLTDLLADMQELQLMLARMDFQALAAKSSHLRGRIVRFKTEAYNLLKPEAAESLDLARDQMESISNAATQVGNIRDETRIYRIQVALGHANESLNAVFAIHRAETHGE